MKSLKLSLVLLLLVLVPSIVSAQQSISPGTANNTLTADNDYVDFAVPNGTATVTITLTGTFVSTNRVDVTVFNNNWTAGTFTQSVPVIQADDNSSDLTMTAIGSWILANPGWVRFRVYATDWTSGTVTVNAVRSDAASATGGGSITGDLMITGFSTEAKQDTGITLLTTIAGRLDTIDSVDYATQTTLAAALTSLQALDNAVAGNEFQVDVLTMPTVTVVSNGLNLLPALAQNATTTGQPGALLFGAVTTAAPSYTTAQSSALSLTTGGLLRVAIEAGAGSGGTALADNSAFTAGTTSDTPVAGLYQASPTNCTDGRACAVGITTGRELKVAATNLDIQSGGLDLLTQTTGALILTSTDFAAAFGTAGTADSQVMSVQGVASMTPLATNISQVNGATFSASNPFFTCLVSNGGSSCITIPTSITVDLDTVGTQLVEGFALLTEGSGGGVAVSSTNPLPVLTTATSIISVVGGVADAAADSGNPIKIGARATTSIVGLTPATANNRIDLIAGVDRVLVVRPYANLEDRISGRVANTDGAATSLVAAQGSGVRGCFTTFIVSNSSATNVTVDITDGNGGTALTTLPAAANMGGSIVPLAVPLCTTANTALYMDGSAAATTVTVTAVGFKSEL